MGNKICYVEGSPFELFSRNSRFMREALKQGKMHSQPSTLQHEENALCNKERLRAEPHNEKQLIHILPSCPYVLNLLENV